MTVSLLGCFGHQPTMTTGLEGKPLPTFNLLLTDSMTKIKTDNIPTGSPIVLFYFSPYCPYCKAQTETMINNMKSMQNIRFYFLSSFPLPLIRQYAEYYKLDKFSNIIVGQDYENYFGIYFKVPGVPYMAIYGKDKLLIQSLVGNVGYNLVKDIALK